MGVEVDGQVEAGPQGPDEAGGGRGPQQPGHVLDAQHVAAGADKALGQGEVVVEGVEALGRVGQVAGVAERPLGQLARLEGRLDGRAHLLHVVEGVEDPEDVDAGAGRLGHEGGGHPVGVGGVADGVATPQQHLQTQVRCRLAQLGQPLPGVLPEEAQGHVVGRPTPRLE